MQLPASVLPARVSSGNDEGEQVKACCAASSMSRTNTVLRRRIWKCYLWRTFKVAYLPSTHPLRVILSSAACYLSTQLGRDGPGMAVDADGCDWDTGAVSLAG